MPVTSSLLPSLARRACLSMLAVAAIAAIGCAAPAEEPTDEGQAGALAEGETEAEVLVSALASSDSKVTGVETWRLSAVKKAGVAEPFLVAIGTKGGKDVLDVVVGRAPDASARVQVVGADEEDLAAAELRRALAVDVKALAERYAAQEGLAMPAAPTTMSDLQARSLGILTKSAPADPCAKEARVWDLLSTVVILQSVATVGVCLTAVGTAGGTAPLCAIAAASTSVSFVTMMSSAKGLKACKEEAPR